MAIIATAMEISDDVAIITLNKRNNMTEDMMEIKTKNYLNVT